MPPVPSTMVPEGAAAPKFAAKNPISRSSKDRTLLILLVIAAPVLATTLGSSPAAVEPDLARLLHFMALLKAVFALVAFGVCFWRLDRPAALWREVVYVAGPAAMAGGALCLWTLQSVWLAALGLHLGLFALVAAGLTDAAFIPPLRRRA